MSDQQEQQQATTFADRVVRRLQDQIGELSVRNASLQSQLEMVVAERDYFLQGLRENGLIQEGPQDTPPPPPPAPEVVPEEDVEVVD